MQSRIRPDNTTVAPILPCDQYIALPMVVRALLSTITLLVLLSSVSSVCWSIFFLARLLCLILTRMRMLRTAVMRRGRELNRDNISRPCSL